MYFSVISKQLSVYYNQSPRTMRAPKSHIEFHGTFGEKFQYIRTAPQEHKDSFKRTYRKIFQDTWIFVYPIISLHQSFLSSPFGFMMFFVCPNEALYKPFLLPVCLFCLSPDVLLQLQIIGRLIRVNGELFKITGSFIKIQQNISVSVPLKSV